MKHNLSYIISGGKPIVGRIKNLGAKNFATKAIIAALLAEGTTILANVPRIGDVEITLAMVASIGVRYDWVDNTTLKIDGSNLRGAAVSMPDSGSNRIPILLLSVLLNRIGEVSVPKLAGCAIGARPIDFHIKVIEMFGGIVSLEEGAYSAVRKAPLKACHYTLPYPSVGATEACLFLAVLAEGTSRIDNVAIEPEIIALITMLNSMGGSIELGVNRTLVIKGVPKLNATYCRVLGDRIEAASWAMLAAATDGNLTVEGIEPTTMMNFFASFNAIGGGIKIEGDDCITFYRKEPLKNIAIATDVYPGFATDWQQPLAVTLSQAEGVSIIHETVYENRFGYLHDLKPMGIVSQLTTHCLGAGACRFQNMNYPHSAIISGKTNLLSEDSVLKIPDLRAGLAYLIAAAMAEGTTTLSSAAMLERGYGDLAARLVNTNLDLKREKEQPFPH